MRMTQLLSEAPQNYAKVITIPSPVSGSMCTVDTLSCKDVKYGVWGPSVAIKLSGYQIVAPFDAQVIMLPETGYEVQFKAANGLRMLVKFDHDLTHLMGERCKRLVRVGQRVKAGAPMLEFDSMWLKNCGYDAYCSVSLPNAGHNISILPTSAKRVMAFKDKLFSLYL